MFTEKVLSDKRDLNQAIASEEKLLTPHLPERHSWFLLSNTF